MMSTTIVLNPWEILFAAQCGLMRQVENIKKQRTPSYGAGDDSNWQIHVEGCLGEYALAKFLGVHWAGKGVLRAPDIGAVDVRTATKDHYCLLLHEEDSDDRRYWLVTGINGAYTVQGWILGRDGKKSEYWKDPLGGRPAFFVPQSILNKP